MADLEDWRNGGFGIYVHWPFCQSKCPYCDFNSHVSSKIDQKVWADAYMVEIDRLARETDGRVVNSIFFGGGTPSLMDVSVVQTVLDSIAGHWSLANNVEISLEANPGSVEATRFSGYRLAGVNRLSMGMQAMNDADLRALGRLHSVDEARRAFEIASNHFDRVSFDLMYARQGQSLTDWEAELKGALEMAVDHLSLYQLTVEDGTAFGDRFARGKLPGLPTEDLAADMYELTQTLCEAHGFPAYEVSNHAKPGAESIHNRIYWKSGDYLGIGPGAHGRMTIDDVRFATEAVKSPGAWLKLLRETGSGEVTRNRLSTIDQADEFILMGMRMIDGIDLARLESITGRRPSERALKKLADAGLLLNNDNEAKATPRGLLVLNHVIEVLATDLG